MTPTAYIASKKQNISHLSEKSIQNSALTSKVKTYRDSQMLEQINISATGDSKKFFPLSKFWNKIINVGRSELLYDAEMRDQLLLLKETLGFTHVRFWDLYNTVIFSNQAKDLHHYNFTRLDRLFDFLIDHDIMPFIEFGFKPLLLLRLSAGEHKFMVAKEQDILFPSTEEYKAFISEFARHYISRYSAETMEKWRFEQWLDPRLIKGEDYHAYFDVFEAAYYGLKSVHSGLKLGGCRYFYK